MSDQTYDLVVIGGGPGGYVAAIRAAQLGMKTACVEGRGSLGGTCLNVGCIPSKALLHSSERFAEARDHLADQGIKVGKLELDLGTMMGRKDKVVGDLTKGIAFLFKKNKVDYVKGYGSIPKAGEVAVKVDGGGEQSLSTRNILIATGSETTPLPGVEIDEKQVVTSTGVLALGKVPKTMVVIGAGVIGLELGSVWSRLGAEVTVIEFLDRILPTMDGEIAKQTQRVLAKQGLKFKLGSKVTGAKTAKSGVTLTVEPAKGGEAESLKAEVVLVSIGRRPFTEGLGLEALGVKADNRGFIQVDDQQRTGDGSIFAIGDVAGEPMLAHKASHEGRIAVEVIAGKNVVFEPAAIPAVVFTDPEIAWAGITETEAKEKNIEYQISRFPWAASGRALTLGRSDGLTKLLVDPTSERILGVGIVSASAGEMIAEGVLAIEMGANVTDIGL